MCLPSMAGKRIQGSQMSHNPLSVWVVFFLSPFTLPDDASFSSFFSFSIDATPGGKDSDGLGGDGLVFTLQTVSNTAGTQGGGLALKISTKSTL